mmetsp:Transcript_24208/g.51621  ORF Transcript_24208/g.51621 Transcript_24208/m.51621 type:complete len:123 (+) Transcript_24208:340-708(+)
MAFRPDGMGTYRARVADTARRVREAQQIRLRQCHFGSLAEALPEVPFEEGIECGICMEADSPENWRRLACGHSFHGCCVIPWLRENGTCPLCRGRLLRTSSSSPPSPASSDGDLGSETGSSA